MAEHTIVSIRDAYSKARRAVREIKAAESGAAEPAGDGRA